METKTYPTEKTDKASVAESEALRKEMHSCAERIWNALSKLVTIDKDGILKDPNWPHLWEHKR
ncbi:MAG: hypothetical protein FJZ95_06810 [Chloroflexi bacterium]|nr:hypothetical protein [Chloroflexota bacterium]